MREAGNSMSSGELRTAFEQCSLAGLSHEDHVHLAFLYLREAELLTVLEEFPAKLQRFVAARGASEKFHTTLTWSWILLVHERVHGASHCSWSQFRARHPELLDSTRIREHYSQQELDSEAARRNFVLPRK